MRFKPWMPHNAVFAILIALVILPCAARAEGPVIVAFGDSLMAGYQLPEADGFPAQLQSALKAKGRNVTVINAGVSGDTTGAGLERLDWSVPDGAALVILELGANDMLRGLDPALAETNLRAMLERLKGRSIPVLLAGMRANPGLGAPYQAAFDAIFPRLAAEFATGFYPFFLEGVAGQPALLLADVMHPNAEGVRRIVGGILPHVETTLSAKSGG